MLTLTAKELTINSHIKHLASPNQKLSHILPYPDEYLRAKNLKYPLIPSSDTVDQKIQQTGWTKSTPGHTKPKKVVSRCYFPFMIITMQKS